MAKAGLIDTLTKRAKLPKQDEPHWQRIEARCYLGYRKTEHGAETWVARYTRKGKYVKHALGELAEMDFDAAQAKARDWFTLLKGGVSTKGSVEDVCKKYVESKRGEKGDRSANDADVLFKQHIYGKEFGQLKFSELTSTEVEAFRNSLVTDDRSKARVNRVMRRVKAAFNWGFEQKPPLCISDLAWRSLKKLKGAGAADGARDVYLTPAQIKALIAESGADLASLIKGLAFTGARPFQNSELLVAKKGDLDLKQKTLKLRHFKGGGDENKREVPLSDSAVDFFRELSKDKVGSETLLFTKEGRAWRRDEWAEEIKAAINAANAKIEDPEKRVPTTTVMYSLRHTTISQWLKAGIGIERVAKWAGTSVKMIEDYYGKFITDEVVRDRLNAANVL